MQFNVNWWVIIVTSVLGYLMGFLWYGILFMKPWMKAVGLKKHAKDPFPGRTMVIGFLITFISIYVLALFIINTGSTTFLGGILVGFLLWLGYSLTMNIGALLWQMKPASYFWINAPYELISTLIVSGILGYFL